MNPNRRFDPRAIGGGTAAVAGLALVLDGRHALGALFLAAGGLLVALGIRSAKRQT